MKLIAVDFETFYDKKNKYTIKGSTSEEYVRDPRFEPVMVCIAPWVDGAWQPVEHWGPDAVKQAIDAIDWADTMMVSWHAHFDASIVSWRYGHRIKAPICSMAMFRMMGYATMAGGESLMVATKWAKQEGVPGIVNKGFEVDEASGKRHGDFTPEQRRAYMRYCRDDTLNAGNFFWYCMQNGFPPSELPAMAEIIRCFTEPTLTINPTVLAVCHAEQVALQEAAMAKAGVTQAQLRSNPKFAQLLRSIDIEPGMKVSPRTNKPTFAFGKSDDFMDGLLNHADPMVVAVAEARVAAFTSIVSTRAKRLWDVGTRGPVPNYLRPGGAHTQRLSGGDKTNQQNLPKRGDIRKGLRAKDGHKLIAVDKSQIELRLNGYVSDDKPLLEMLRKGADVYSKYGNDSGMFDFEVSRLTELARFFCKQIVLGAGFGSGAAALEKQIIKLARDLGMVIDLSAFNFEDAKNAFRSQRKPIVTNWHQTNEQLGLFIEGQSSQRGRDGLVNYVAGKGFRMPNGMFIWYRDLDWKMREAEKGDTEEEVAQKEHENRIYGPEMFFTGRRNNRNEKMRLYGAKAVENYIQGLSALNVREDWVEIVRRQRKEIGTRWGSIKMQVHDELIAHVKDEAVEDYRALMLDVMKTPPWWAPDLPLDAEAAVGKTYGDV